VLRPAAIGSFGVQTCSPEFPVSICVPVFSNNAMVIPTAIHQLVCAAHKASLRFLKPLSAEDVTVLHCDVPRMPSYVHWLHVFVKVSSSACILRTADNEARRSSFLRDRSTEYEAAGLLLEEVIVIRVAFPAAGCML
jgi:hypothetical protein